MTPTELIEPTIPTAPEKDDNDLSELRTALATAVTALSKNKNIIITNSDIRSWSEPEGQITFKIKSTHEKYVEYDKQQRAYNQAKRDYDNQKGALEHGVTVEQYIEAKKRFDEYQSKKCDKLPDHELGYFINKVINIQIQEVSDLTPELTTS